MRLFVSFHVILAAVLAVAPAYCDDPFDQEPIRYKSTEPVGPTADLAAGLAQGSLRLEYREGTGYLASLLEHLGIPQSSQTLVFSKTSLQRERIGPARPRAIYFNDDVYVGFVNGGEVIEVAATDPRLGTVFYTLDQRENFRARLTRQTDNCLQCHGGSMTRQVPGLLVRSVKPDGRGLPILRAGTDLTTHESPLGERWGGWYVTGTHGKQPHLGNAFWQEDADGQAGLVPGLACLNVTDLSDRFDASAYLRADSDIVALMVLEHQVEGHNLITRANFFTRLALHDAKVMNEALNRPPGFMSDSTLARIRGAAEPLVKYLLFCGEAALGEPIAGAGDFTREFEARGRRDAEGRSLRQLDLQRRMFRYPLSYLVYSDAFAGLPTETKEYVWRRMHEVLSGKDQGREFAHLSPEDRRAVLGIVRSTCKGSPDDWRAE